MTEILHNEDIKWKILKPAESSEALGRVLEAWKGTPYREGQCVRKMGCNCVFLGAGVLDDLFDMEDHKYIPRLRGDQTLLDPRLATRVVLAMVQHWHRADIIRDRTIEPGDILVSRATNTNVVGAPEDHGHLMLVSNIHGEIYECSQSLGVYSTHLHHARPIHHIYRPRRKDLWATRCRL